MAGNEFDPDAYLQMKRGGGTAAAAAPAEFDPDAYLQTKGIKVNDPGIMERIGEGAQAFNDNFQRVGRNIPVLGPLAVRAGNVISAGIDAALPNGTGEGDTYLDRAQDAYSRFTGLDAAREKQFEAEHPHVALQERMAGGMLVPEMGAETAGARIAAMGGMQDIDSRLRGASTQDAAGHGLMAAGMQAGIEAVPVVGNAIAGGVSRMLNTDAGESATNAVQDFANRKAFKALEPDLRAETLNRNKWVARPDAPLDEAGNLIDKSDLVPQSEAIGQTLRDEGVIRFGSGVKGINSRAEALRGEAGQAVGQALKSADEYAAHFPPQISNNFKISPSSLADDIEASVAGSMKSNYADQGDLSALERHLEMLRSENVAGTEAEPVRWTLAEANAQKSIIGKKIKAWNKLPPEQRPADQAAYETVYHALNDAIETKMENLDRMVQMYDKEDGNFANTFESAKDRFGPAAEAEKITDKAIARNERNRSLSLTSYLAGGAAGTAASHQFGPVIGGAVGLAAGAANMAIKHRGNSSMSAIAGGGYDIMNMLQQNPGALGEFWAPLNAAAQRGPAALAAAHYVMSQKDPGYQKLINPNGQ